MAAVSDGVLAVVPVLDWKRHGEPCINSMCAKGSSFGIAPEDVLIVDNAREANHRYAMRVELGGLDPMRYYRDPDGHNLGVARSWNVGVRMLADSKVDEYEYLLLVSSVMRFGPTLHTTWLEQMQRVWGQRVIEADGHSWHLIAFHRSVFETIGLFDPAFYPGYVEAIDFGRRLRLVGWEGGWARMWVNAMSAGVAAHLDLVSCPWAPLDEVYRAKWGGPKGEETFDRPYGDKPLDYIVEEPIPVLAQRYGLEMWW